MTSFHASRVLTIDTILKSGPGKMLSRPCSLGIPIKTYRNMKDCRGLSLNKNIGKIVEVSPHLQSHPLQDSPTFIHLFSLGEMKLLWILSVYVKKSSSWDMDVFSSSHTKRIRSGAICLVNGSDLKRIINFSCFLQEGQWL